MSTPEKRAVSGSFIFRFPNDDVLATPQVALFLRSDKVNAYKHKYAPISGSIEERDASPLAAAWRELHEKTTLTESSLRLYRQGKPYSFTDKSLGREWTINPFAFVLLSPKQGGTGDAGIKLNDEHVSFQWFDLDDLADEASFQGVPRLYESLRRVWFDFDLGREAASPLRTGLLALQQDRTRTASQLASLALAVFIEVISKMDTRHSREAWWRNARMAAWHIWKNGRESTTAPILHVVLNSLVIVETLLPAKAPAEELPSDFSEDVAPSVRDYARQRTDSEDRIFEMFVSFLDVTFPTNEELNILTLSFSSTVLSCIEDTLDLEHQRRMGRKLHIHVLESRPLFEGVRMAKSIASYSEKLKLETNISVHTDASVAHAAQGVDLVLLGADAIAQNGDIFNKTGSLPAILAARHVSPVAKIVVLSDKEKITPFSDPFHEEHSPKELLQAWGDLGPEGGQYQSDAGVKFSVNNTRIERVPSSFIDYYVMEDGFRTSNDMPGLAERVEKAAERYFSDLGNCE